MGQSTAADLRSDPVGDESNQCWSGDSSADLRSASEFNLTWILSHFFKPINFRRIR